MKYILYLFLFLCSSIILASTPGKMYCTPPTAYTDGSPLTEPLTFDLYCKKDSTIYTDADKIQTATTCEFIPTGSIVSTFNGPYNCAVVAYGTTKSAFSNSIKAVFNSGQLVLIEPNKPTNLGVVPLQQSLIKTN